MDRDPNIEGIWIEPGMGWDAMRLDSGNDIGIVNDTDCAIAVKPLPDGRMLLVAVEPPAPGLGGATLVRATPTLESAVAKAIDAMRSFSETLHDLDVAEKDKYDDDPDACELCADGMGLCLKSNPGTSRFRCTRPDGHEGNHAACAKGYHPLTEWGDE